MKYEDTEILKKIKETFDSAIKISAFLMPLCVLNPNETKSAGITIENLLLLNKNYYDINEWLKEQLGE